MILVSCFMLLESSFTSRAGPLQGPRRASWRGAVAGQCLKCAFRLHFSDFSSHQRAIKKQVLLTSTKTLHIRESIDPCPHASVIRLEGTNRKSPVIQDGLAPLPSIAQHRFSAGQGSIGSASLFFGTKVQHPFRHAFFIFSVILDSSWDPV